MWGIRWRLTKDLHDEQLQLQLSVRILTVPGNRRILHPAPLFSLAECIGSLQCSPRVINSLLTTEIAVPLSFITLCAERLPSYLHGYCLRARQKFRSSTIKEGLVAVRRLFESTRLDLGVAPSSHEVQIVSSTATSAGMAQLFEVT